MGVLKIAGLILLSLFCLALLIVILVLAVPVRYRIFNLPSRSSTNSQCLLS